GRSRCCADRRRPAPRGAAGRGRPLTPRPCEALIPSPGHHAMSAGKGTNVRRIALGLLAVCWTLLLPTGRSFASDLPTAFNGWTTFAPREEIRPEFSVQTRTSDGCAHFVIKAGGREGVDGCWKKTIPVVGGKSYQFQAYYRARGVAVPRRSIVAEIHWQD